MSVHIDIEVTENEIKNEQAGAELGQAQVSFKLAIQYTSIELGYGFKQLLSSLGLSHHLLIKLSLTNKVAKPNGSK